MHNELTFLQWLKQELTNNGLFEEQVEDVTKLILENDDLLVEFRGRWNEPLSAYPSMMQGLIWTSVKMVVLDYIDRTCPNAWFRPVFLPQEEQEKFLAQA